MTTPLLTKLLALASHPHAAFYAPGHKRGQGIFQELAQTWGKEIFASDLPELPDLDNLFAPAGVIAKAQRLAAQTFGAQQTWFLVNGSTCGIVAAILATCQSGDKILLPRNIHQSAIAGLILSGAIPVFVEPPYDSAWELSFGLTPDSIERALQLHPDLRAVVVLSPTYQGVCANLKAIANVVHRYHIPLIVDEAHGSHFHFHPNLPPTALAQGADLAIQSTHKTLGAMTQASMLHLQGSLVAPQKINRALQLVQSTSPSYLLLASLDAAREQMATEGDKLWSDTLNLVQQTKQELSTIHGLKIFDPEKQLGCHAFDQTRLTLNTSELGLTGYEADAILYERLGVTAELPLRRSLTFIFTFGNTQDDITQLAQALRSIAHQSPQSSATSEITPLLTAGYIYELPRRSPRDAFFAAHEAVALEDSVGEICAELICPYPPGIPLVMPGETITSKFIEILKTVVQLGGVITGASDPSLKKINIIL